MVLFPQTIKGSNLQEGRHGKREMTFKKKAIEISWDLKVLCQYISMATQRFAREIFDFSTITSF